MLKKKKRMLSIVLVIVMLLMNVPLTVLGSFNENVPNDGASVLRDPFSFMYDADELLAERLHEMVKGSITVSDIIENYEDVGTQTHIDGRVIPSSERAELQGMILEEFESLPIESEILEIITELSDSYLKRAIAYHEQLYTNRFIVRFRAENQVNVDSNRANSSDSFGDSFIESFTQSFTQIYSQDLTKNSTHAPRSLVQSFSDQSTGRMELIVLGEKVNPRELADELRASGAGQYIEYIQPDFTLSLAGLVNDEASVVESSLSESNQMISSSASLRRRASVVVAVIDTGVDSTHPMLTDYMVEGWNFLGQNNITFDSTRPLASAHGTHIAGIIVSAAQENGADIKIMPLQVFDNGRAYTSDIIAAINFAIENGASIINSSFGSTEENPALYETITNANAFFVCAVGNNRRDMDVMPSYPAAYRLPNVISVGSVNVDGGLSFFSNYSEKLVDITAPGRDIVSTLPGGQTGLLSGTSMSTAYVTGIAAVLLSQSLDMTPAELRERILSSADRLSNLQTTVNMGRRANKANALAGIAGSSLSLEPTDDFNVHGYQRTREEVWELFAAAGSVVQVAGGGNHSLALMADGTVWAWGANQIGQLGQGIASISETLVQVVGLTDVTYIAAGSNHSFALRADGTVWSWGGNSLGQLGDGMVHVPRFTPVQVSGLIDVIAISTMVDHSLAVRADGTAWMWGLNFFGQLGLYEFIVATPIQVRGLTDVIAVAAGGQHNLAVRADGTVWAWGSNVVGQLGDSTTTHRFTSVQVSGLNDAVSIAAGENHSVALMADGTVWAWGSNVVGQIGDGTTTNRTTPVQVSGLNGVTVITSGLMHSMALRADETVWTWGEMSLLHVNMQIFQSINPIQINGIADIVSIASGDNHSLALRSDGTIWAWGSNTRGQLGRGEFGYSAVPILVRISGNDSGNKPIEDKTIDIEVIAGGTYTVFLSVDNIPTFEDKVFRLIYDPNMLISTGLTHQANVTVISTSRGETAFTVNTQVQQGRVWSGVLAVAAFNALTTGETTVVLTIGEPPPKKEWGVVRFHFGNIVNNAIVTHEVDVPILLGQSVASLGNLIPVPATRYGRVGTPGQAFMGWFTQITVNMHYVNNPNRATAFNLNTSITESMLDNNGIFHLHGSWLQFGDVNGDGRVDDRDFLLLQQRVGSMPVNIIEKTADVNVDGIIGVTDLLMVQQFFVGLPVILGIPQP